MKTFEERYTAWIDGQLEGGALTAFEQELTRRAAEGEAEADKAGRRLPAHAVAGPSSGPGVDQPRLFQSPAP